MIPEQGFFTDPHSITNMANFTVFQCQPPALDQGAGRTDCPLDSIGHPVLTGTPAEPGQQIAAAKRSFGRTHFW